MIVQCICLNAIWSIHIQTIMIYVGFQCIVFNIVSGRLLTFACGMIPDFSFQFHASVWAICKQNGGEIKSWSLASSSDPTVWPFKTHGITLQELHQFKWMHHLWPRNHFFSMEMDGTKPLIRYASPTCLLSLHKGSATKCYHHHDFKTQTATGFNFIREHFFIFFPSLFSWLLATVVQPSIFRIRSPGGPLLPGLAFGGGLSGAEEGLANGRWRLQSVAIEAVIVFVWCSEFCDPHSLQNHVRYHWPLRDSYNII